MRRERATISTPIRTTEMAAVATHSATIAEDVGRGVGQPQRLDPAASIASTPVAATVIGP